jgi:hypothetical protein
MEIKGISDFLHWFWDTNQSTALLGIVLGIVFKFVFDYYTKYTKAKDKTKIKFDKKGFWLTAVISLFLSILLYSTLLSKVAELHSDLLVLSISMQSGFFWQSILDRLRAKE